jgi:hypothetical protein
MSSEMMQEKREKAVKMGARRCGPCHRRWRGAMSTSRRIRSVPYLPPKNPEFTLKMSALCQVCGPQRGYIPRQRMDGMCGERHGRGVVHMAGTP